MGALVKKLVSVVTALLSVLGCGHPSERLETASVSSKKLGREMLFAVLRAPTKTGRDPGRLPLVVFLHGMGGKHTDFDRYAVSDAVHHAMETGDVPSAHLIFPSGERGFYLNWYDGTMPYEDYILEEVIPEAEKMLGTSPNRDHRHIAGVSMGGTGALQIGLRHPERFGSVTSISGVVLNREQALDMMRRPLMRLLLPIERIWGDGTDEVFSNSINAFELVPGKAPRPPQKIFLTHGTDESEQIQDTTRAFHEHLEANSVDHKFVVFEGRHKWKYWIPVIKQSLRYVLSS